MSRAVMIEAGHRCAMCGETSALDVHHIIPWEKVQKHEQANLICLCAVCHRRAGDNEMDRGSLRQYKTSPWVKTRGAPAPVRQDEGTQPGQTTSSRNIVVSGAGSVAAKEIRNSIIMTGNGNTLAIGQDERRDRENRMGAFRAHVFSLRGNFDDVEDHKLVEAHAESRSGVRAVAAKVRDDIPSGKREEFDGAVSAYCALTRESIECRDRTQQPPAARDRFGNYTPGRALGWQPEAHYELGRERISKLLDKLLECAE